VILNISPKLLRPLVEVEVRAEDAKYGGMDRLHPYLKARATDNPKAGRKRYTRFVSDPFGRKYTFNRCVILNISPKLLRPLVEVEVRAEDAKYGGMDKSMFNITQRLRQNSSPPSPRHGSPTIGGASTPISKQVRRQTL
jgi:hypothetical protein